MGVIVSRLVSLQITDFKRWQDWALKQHLSEIQLSSERGPIYDRNNRLLAVSVPAGSVYVRPKQVKDRLATARQLGKLLGMETSQVMEKFSSPQPFVWVKRQIPREKAEEIAAQKIPGVDYLLETKRYYPFGKGASALVGKVGVDGNGLSGLE
ncbi:MAG: penicillin-binding protein, partial [Proteobacteria bacterium]